jgi:hypothetical protein
VCAFFFRPASQRFPASALESSSNNNNSSRKRRVHHTNERRQEKEGQTQGREKRGGNDGQRDPIYRGICDERNVRKEKGAKERHTSNDYR